MSIFIDRMVRPMFAQRVLPVTEDIMFKWRLLVEDGRKARHAFSPPDLIIAATALERGFTIVSRDTSDYEKARVPTPGRRLARTVSRDIAANDRFSLAPLVRRLASTP